MTDRQPDASAQAASPPSSRWGGSGSRRFAEVVALWRQVRHDVRRVVRGFGAFVGYLRKSAPVEIGLGELSAASRLGTPGVPSRYLATLCNAAVEPRRVTLAVDIRPVAAAESADAAGVSISVPVTVRPHGSTWVEIEYDWIARLDVFVDGGLRSLHDVRMASSEGRARYAVSASLLDAEGRCRERLTIYQELSR